jgi:hypothetical protein
LAGHDPGLDPGKQPKVGDTRVAGQALAPQCGVRSRVLRHLRIPHETCSGIPTTSQGSLTSKNRITQYMGPTSAYAAVLRAIEQDVTTLLRTNPNPFAFSSTPSGMVDIRDFQTTGVVAFARGLPFSRLSAGKQSIGGYRVQVNEGQRILCLDAIDALVAKL